MVTNKDCISFDFADIRGAPLKRGYHAPGTQYSIIPAFHSACESPSPMGRKKMSNALSLGSGPILFTADHFFQIPNFFFQRL